MVELRAKDTIAAKALGMITSALPVQGQQRRDLQRAIDPTLAQRKLALSLGRMIALARKSRKKAAANKRA